jgi:hypothetical protein
VNRAAIVALAVAAGCGGKPPPPPAPAAPPPPKRAIIEDSETEDGVEVVSSHGHMEPAVVEAGIDPHRDELMECYASRLGKRRWLGGHVTLHWDITKAGVVTAVKISESDLGAWPVEKCLLEIAKAATFGKPVGGDADFALPLDFSARGKLVVWDDDASQKAVGKQLAKLDACAKGKVRVPTPDDVTITAYAGPAGAPQSVGFSSSKSVIDPAWADCAEKAALAWKLTDPRGMIAKLAVRYRAN